MGRDNLRNPVPSASQLICVHCHCRLPQPAACCEGSCTVPGVPSVPPEGNVFQNTAEEGLAPPENGKSTEKPVSCRPSRAVWERSLGKVHTSSGTGTAATSRLDGISHFRDQSQRLGEPRRCRFSAQMCRLVVEESIAQTDDVRTAVNAEDAEEDPLNVCPPFGSITRSYCTPRTTDSSWPEFLGAPR